MTITGAIVLFSVTWFMVFFVVLPLRLVTQGDADDVVPGTPRAAPHGFVVARKARITTVVTIILWLVFAAIISSGWISVRDLDWFGRMSPPQPLP